MANEQITLTNVSRQMIPVQIKPPNGDFYLHERQARIMPGKSLTVPLSHVSQGQIENLKARHELRITSGS